MGRQNSKTNIKVRSEILDSLARCNKRDYLNPTIINTETISESQTKKHWNDLNLEKVAKQELGEIERLAKSGAYVTAISDFEGNLLWTSASQQMKEAAETANYVPGGKWAESSAGTNAIGLTLLQNKPTTVLSSEHYFTYFHNYVTYASPIINPDTKELAGVLSFATTRERHSSLSQTAVLQLSNTLAPHFIHAQPKSELKINAMGACEVVFRGENLILTRRQVEIICLLALNPQGMSLDELHAGLYGDKLVCKSTLKAEISRLRKLLGGKIDSRPYRLMTSVWCDFIDFWGAVNQKNIEDAASLFRGTFLPNTTSPVLSEWQRNVDFAAEQLVQSCNDPSVLIKNMCQSSSCQELVQNRLQELLTKIR